MSLFNIIDFIWNHPLASKNRKGAFIRFLKWHIAQKLHPMPIVYPFVESSKLLISKGMVGATGNIYTGLHEFNDMTFLLHFLREGDLFIDIGANIGSYTVLASSVSKASTIAIEPVPETFKNLSRNIVINNITDKVESFNIGLGSKKSVLKFTADMDSMNHVATQNDKASNIIDIHVDTLDNVLLEKEPVLLKIDVEGFEQEVLHGAQVTLSKNALKAIIIEINDTCEKYGLAAAKTHQMLLDHNFKPYTYSPFDRNLVSIDQSTKKDNIIYIRGIDDVKGRLVGAKKIKVLNIDI